MKGTVRFAHGHMGPDDPVRHRHRRHLRGICGGLFTPIEASGIGGGVLIISAVQRKLTWQRVCRALVDTASYVAGHDDRLPHDPLPRRDRCLAAHGRLGFPSGPERLHLPAGCRHHLPHSRDHARQVRPAYPDHPLSPTRWSSTSASPPCGFGVSAVIMSEVGLLPPPVGVNVFVMHDAAPDIPMKTIFRGALRFMIMNLIPVVILTISRFSPCGFPDRPSAEPPPPLPFRPGYQSVFRLNRCHPPGIPRVLVPRTRVRYTGATA